MRHYCRARPGAYSDQYCRVHVVVHAGAGAKGISGEYAIVKDGDRTLHGLVHFDIARKTGGIVGTGKVGQIVVRVLIAFG